MGIRETNIKLLNKFGTKAQVIVAIEELCEFVSAIAKYPRYDNSDKAVESTKEKVLDEYCDMMIVLSIIALAYELKDEEIEANLKGLNKTRECLRRENPSFKISFAIKSVCQLSDVVSNYIFFGEEHTKERDKNEVLGLCVKAYLSLDLIAGIYGFTDDSINPHLKGKLNRMERWEANAKGNSLEVTTTDRAVIEEKSCTACGAYNDPDDKICIECQKEHPQNNKENKQT